MRRFESFLIEQKNTHMEHIEDLVFNEGVNGARQSILFLRDLRDMLAGSSKSSVSATVKWDGAPAVFCGIDPSDKKFFVAKKGIFNKNPKVYKTPADVKADTQGDLQTKLLLCLEHLPKLGIKKGVYQGDLMFTQSDLKNTTIDGEKYITFHPNTILYAVPQKVSAEVKRAKVGIVFHTTYTGNSFENMRASFGKNITSKFKKSGDVWAQDAIYKDVSGSATFTAAETKQVTAVLSQAGKLFNGMSKDSLNDISSNSELLLRVKTFNNTLIRAGKRPNTSSIVNSLVKYITDYYKKEEEKRKTPDGKQKQKDKARDILKYFSKHSKSDIQKVYELMYLLVDAKQMIIDKMNEAGSIGTFVRTRNGFKTTNQEGFVAIDKMSGGAVKLVDRMEFSRMNFNDDVIKGWQK